MSQQATEQVRVALLQLMFTLAGRQVTTLPQEGGNFTPREDFTRGETGVFENFVRHLHFGREQRLVVECERMSCARQVLEVAVTFGFKNALFSEDVENGTQRRVCQAVKAGIIRLFFLKKIAMIRAVTGFVAGFVAVLALTACSAPVEDTRPGQPVKHRQDAFTALLKKTEAVGLALQEDRFNAERIQALVGQVTDARDEPWKYFGADTNYPPSKSLPEVWGQPEAFEAQRAAFFEAAEALSAAKDEASVRDAYQKLSNSCKSCHDKFKRERD